MPLREPFTVLGLQPSFGFGDRTGLATPGHIEAMNRAGAGIAPIFAQQSIREMSRTGRTPQEVVDAAVKGMEQGGWTDASGADADHLKTPADVDVTAAVGFTFYTIDPSDHVDGNADDYNEQILREQFATIRHSVGWCDSYLNRRIELPNGRSFTIDEQATMLCAVKYGRAIEQAITLAKYIRKNGLALISIAPKFIGDFEKGVDYKGDIGELERSLSDHAALARELGPYKLSLHSGSDKLSLYPILAKTTNGCFHVKTAGTSYLEALRVVARHDEPLFRRVIEVSRRYYDRDKVTYHVSADIQKLPSTDDVRDVVELEKTYLERWSDVPAGKGFTEPGRQVLHCTFGTILMDPELGPLIRQLLQSHNDTYTEVLADHFERHLRALNTAL
jgi:tagaturonate epimerase